MSNVSVRLQTLCGCTQIRLVAGPAPQSIEVPISVTTPDDGGPIQMKTRRFRLTSRQPADVAVEADYQEVVDRS